MAIITTTKLVEILPQAATISKPVLTSAIKRAQAIVESPQGADRILEKQEFTQSYQLNLPSQSFYIDNWPVDIALPIALEARLGNGQNDRVSNAPIPIQPYILIEDDGYEMNAQTGEITIYNHLSNPGSMSFGRGGFLGGTSFTEVKISYTGGYDFCDETDKDAERVQTYFSSVLNYMLSDAGFYDGVGVKKKKVDKQYEIEYFDQAGSSGANSFFNIPEPLLMPFYQYRPNLYDY